MTHRFPIKEIARQSGLGPATVDRVLNKRANVSAQSRARVERAIDELEGQEALLSARGRRLFFDFVVEAPSRFSQEVKRAAETVAPQMGSAVCRSRFILQEVMTVRETVATLKRIQKRGSHGVCLKARDVPDVRQAVQELVAANIPVVTLVTDIADTPRSAYVGLDNAGAGRTAAHLMAMALGRNAGTVLATRSSDLFSGEQAREDAFVAEMTSLCPNMRVVSIAGGSGQNFETAKLIAQAAGDFGDLRGVYSMGGGNRAILAALADAGHWPDIYIAHDLDRENIALLQDARLSFVMHHDLHHDLGQVFQAFLAHHGLMAPSPDSSETSFRVSDIQVITPQNLPHRFMR